MADEEDQLDDEPQEDGELEEGEGSESGGSKKKLLMIIVPILLLIGGGAGAYFTGMLDSLLGVEAVAEGEEGEDSEEDAGGDKKSKKDKKDKKSKKGKKDKKNKKGKDSEYDKEGEESAFLAIPTIIVNLNTEDGTPRYLRLTVQLEMEDVSDKGAVQAVIPRVIDQFQTYLRELRVRDLRGSAGIYRLQMELLWRVNQATAPIEIKDVLFQEILIQ